ncbi:MAG: autotransporter-associated beta strand repeat-containing protein, partial [Chthoniobacteraceae bacterium]
TALANILGGDVVVNGATFVGAANAGTGWTLNGAGTNFTGFTPGGVSGSITGLFNDFQYGGNPATFDVSGLTVGQTYVATFYNAAFGGVGGRRTTVSGNGASTVFDENSSGANVLRHTFVATGATTTLSFTPAIASDTWHFYGFSNEQVFNNTWTGSSGNWNTPGSWSTGIVPNGVGSNALFGPQPGPTDVFSTTSRTVGHIGFQGTNSYTLSGVVYRLQADAGGVSVLSAEAGGSHTIDASVQLLSDTVKYGGGTLTLAQEVFGSKSLSVNAGTLRFGFVNNYTGGTSVGGGATLDLNGIGQSLGPVNGAGTILNDAAGIAVATIDSGTFSGVVSDHSTGTGVVALTKATSGTLTLSGTNTYTGATTVNGGTLRLAGTGTTTILLTDNFSGTGNPNTADLNFNLANRQTGTAALQNWTGAGNSQLGNATGVQAPAGTNGDYLLLAFGGSATLNDLPLSTANVTGPLKVSFDAFKGSGGDATDWTSFVVRSAGGNGFPITGSGEFGFLYRQNTGIQVFNNGGLLQDIGSTTRGDSFAFYLADSAGTGSPFAGNGTKLVITQGGTTIGGYNLNTGLTATSFLTFGSGGTTISGVDNLTVAHSPVFQTNVLSPTTNVNLNSAGARFELAEVNQTVATLAGVAGSVVDIGPLSKLTVNATTASSFSGTITGVLGSLVKDGPAQLELNATNSFGAGTTIAAGTVITHASNGLGTGAISIASGANFLPWYNTGSPVIPNNFTLNGLGGNPGDGNKSAIYADGGVGGYSEYVLTGSVTLAATSNIGGNDTNNQRVIGQITGPGGLTKGSGRPDENSALTLSNTANDYAGDTVITNGTIRLGASQVIPDGAGKGKVIMSAGTTLDLAGYSEQINNISGLGTITSNPAVIVGAPVFFSTNLDSGISLATTYTHRLDFGDGTAATINNVAFDPAANGGPGYTLAGATFLLPEGAGAPSTPTFSDAPNGTAMNQFLSDFYYNGNPATLTLTGLTPATSYELRLYQRQWGGDRTQLFLFNSGPSSGSLIYDQDISATPSYLSFRYTADASGTATLSTTQLGAGTYHWYGLTNEVVVDTAPLSVLTVGDASNSIYSGAISGALEIDKVGTGILMLNGTLAFDTLTASEGTVRMGSAILNSLDIADGATVVLTTDPPPASELARGDAVQAVPEPGSIALLFGGMLTLLGRRRRSA